MRAPEQRGSTAWLRDGGFWTARSLRRQDEPVVRRYVDGLADPDLAERAGVELRLRVGARGRDRADRALGAAGDRVVAVGERAVDRVQAGRHERVGDRAGHLQPADVPGRERVGVGAGPAELAVLPE